MEIFRVLGALVEPPSPDRERLAAALELGPLPAAADPDLGVFDHIMGLQDRFYSIQNYPFFRHIPEGSIFLY